MSEHISDLPSEHLLSEELSSETPTSLESSTLHEPLAQAAKKARRAVAFARRGFDAVGQEAVETPFTPPVVLMPSITGIVGGVTALLTKDFGFAAGFGAMLYTTARHSWPQLISAQDSTVQLPYEGYGLQCFQVRQETTSCKKGEVVMYVIPRAYELPEKKAASIASKRLRDVANVAKTANPDKLLIPSEVLRAAHTPLVGNQLLGRLLNDATRSQVDAHQANDTALLISPIDFARMIEAHTINSETTHAQVMAALYERYPHVEAFAQADANAFAALEHLLKPLTERAVSGVLPGAQRARLQQEDGSISTERTTLPPPELRPTDHHDILVTQRDAQHQVVEAFSLIALGEELKADENLFTKLTLGREGYSDLQLLAIAAHSLHQHRDETEGVKIAAHKQEVPIPLGREGRRIQPVITKGERRREMLRFSAIIASLGAVSVATGGAINPFISAEEPLPPAAPPVLVFEIHAPSSNEMSGIGFAASQASGNELPEWKVAPFNMNGTGYYATDFHYNLDLTRGGWAGELPKGIHFTLPTGLADPNQSRITLSRPLDGSQVYNLAFRYGTQFAAARIRAADGSAVPVELVRSKDGMTSAVIPQQKVGEWLEYDLVHGDKPIALPQQPTSATSELSHNPSFIKGKGTAYPQEWAYQFQKHFYYSNSPELERISSQQTADNYMHAMQKAGICNCNVCATGLTLVRQHTHPHIPLAYTTGFLNKDKGDSFLYARHAWVTDQEGRPAEGTPWRQKPQPQSDSPSTSNESSKQDKIRNEWEAKVAQLTSIQTPEPPQPESPPLPMVWMLGSLGVAALGSGVLLELQTGTLGRGLRRARRFMARRAAEIVLSDTDASALFNWHLYGKPTSPPPTRGGTARYNSHLLPERALRKIAAEGIPSLEDYFTREGINPADGQLAVKRAAQTELLGRVAT